MPYLPQGRWTHLRVVAVGLCLLAGTLHAQSVVSPEDEYRKAIKVSEDIQPLGDNPFGEQISLYNGGLSFEQTDVSLKGTGPLLQLSRDFKLLGQKDFFTVIPDQTFGDWEINLPRIETLTSHTGTLTSWQTSGSATPTAQRNQRCSLFYAPPSVSFPGDTARGPWEPSEWWNGYHLIVPGNGDQELMPRSSVNTLAPTIAGKSFSIVTKQHWEVGCLPATTSGEPGEAFFAVAPDGTKYWFDYLVYHAATTVRKPLRSGPGPGVVANLAHPGPQPNASAEDFITRRKAWMLATRIEDRFGNSLVYHYTAGKLTSIDASDGRQLTVQYIPNSPRVASVTLASTSAGSRTWIYQYGTDPYRPPLTRVQLPDGKAWTYNLTGLVTADINFEGGRSGSCYVAGEPASVNSIYTGSITHPSGLTGTFQVKPMKHGRSNVYRECWGVRTAPQIDGYAITPSLWYSLTLISKNVTGAGLSPEIWSYQYSPPNNSWSVDCTASAPCPSTIYTDVIDPAGRTTRYTFSNRYDYTESLLLRTDYYQSNTTSAVVRSDVNQYAPPTAGPWPLTIGYNLQFTKQNSGQTEQLFPLNQRTIVQDGDTYTWQAQAFDNFAQVTQTQRSNNVAGQTPIVERTAYLNDTPHWVLGLPTTTTNVGTGEVMSRNDYDLANVTLSARYRFGQRLMSYTFNPQGQLASFTDGNNHTTTLGNYQRGIPRAIAYADGTIESLTVDDFGQILSHTDQGGFTTGYSYDPVGRITRIAYPGAEWAAKTFAYDYVAAAERGVAAGHWRRTASKGAARTVTYFDAQLRPLLADTYINGDDTSHTNVRSSYDWKGQTVFQSYPIGGVPALSAINQGTRTSYDALGRMLYTQADSELGALTSRVTYLAGARQQLTDPKGRTTTNTFQVFDQPAYDALIAVQAPGGINQAVTRDIYGNPTAIRQYGSYAGQTGDVTKTLAYDGYHRLCRTTEPESGSTAMGYDSANNIAWTVDGLTAGSGCIAQPAGATVRSYDAMNRLKTLAPPSGTQSTTYGYDTRGNLASTVSGIATWTAIYNPLGLVTGEAMAITGQPTRSIGYGYDANAGLASIQYPNGSQISYAPDARGRPKAAGPYASAVSYFANGDMQSFAFGNGALYLAQQNARQLMADFTYAKNVGAPDLSEGMSYDANANITQISDLAGGPRTKAFGYDVLNRLTSASASGLWGDESYAYDPLNNLRSITRNGQINTYNYPGNNLLASITSGASTVASFAYDSRGNVITKNGVSLDFDAKNQLLSLPGKVSYAYDAAGRRVRKTPQGGASTFYFYTSGGKLLYQFEPATAKATNFIYLGNKLIARDEGYDTHITGNIEGVTIDGSGSASIRGWACSTGLTQSIAVHLYVGGAAGTGTAVGAYTANEPAEAGVLSACQVSSGNYRFTIPLSNATRAQFGGQPIYIHGISPVGGDNLTIGQSGSFTVPAAAVAGAPTLSVPASSTNGAYTVTWSAVTGANSYTLQEQINGGTWTTVLSSAATSWSTSGRSNGAYGYRVQACNASGCAAWSTPGSVTVLLPPPAPASISVPATSNGPIAISWAASPTATIYGVDQSVNGGAWSQVYASSPTSTTINAGATGSYQYRAYGCNASACSGYTVSSAVAVTIAPASAPSVSVPASSSTGSYTVSWTGVPGTTSYTLQEQTNGGGWTTIVAAYVGSQAIGGKGSGTYGYRVQACNAGGCGPWSATGSIAVTLLPAAAATPTVTGVSGYIGSFSASWPAAAGATSYQIEIMSPDGVPPSTQTGTSISGLVHYTGYVKVRVKSCNASGCAAWSDYGITYVQVDIHHVVTGEGE